MSEGLTDITQHRVLKVSVYHVAGDNVLRFQG